MCTLVMATDEDFNTSLITNDSLEDQNNQQKDAVTGKTHVSLLHEMCVAFKFGIPRYEFENETGDAHLKTFSMSVNCNSLGLKEIGVAKTKMQAKHNAANLVMQKIHEAALNGIGLHEIAHETIIKCSEMLNQSYLIQPEPNSIEFENAAGRLKEWAFENDVPPPTFDVDKISGPPHNKIFVMICKKDEHVTKGEGKSKKVAKNIAALEMMKLLNIV